MSIRLPSTYGLVKAMKNEGIPGRRGKVRLETLDEFLIDPVRSYLNSILSKIADNEGQGFWLQAEFGVGKSHLLASTAILALGGPDAWNRAKEREDEEKKAGPGARIDSLWRKKIEKRKLFPVVFSLEGVGGTQQKKLEDFILDAAQEMFGLREGKPLAVYPEEHLAKLFLNQHLKNLKDDLRSFLADQATNARPADLPVRRLDRGAEAP